MALEKRISEGGESSISSASMAEIQQVLLPGAHWLTFNCLDFLFFIIFKIRILYIIILLLYGCRPLQD